MATATTIAVIADVEKTITKDLMELPEAFSDHRQVSLKELQTLVQNLPLVLPDLSILSCTITPIPRTIIGKDYLRLSRPQDHSK